MNEGTVSDVSVLLPIAPKSNYLEKTLESLLFQTFEEWILIAVYDSNDTDTSILLRRMIPKEKLIEIQVLGNLNLSERLNAGIAKCTTRFICRMDADDLYAESRIEKQRNFLINHEAETNLIAIVGSQAIVIDEMGTEISKITQPLDDHHIRRKLIWRNSFLHPSLFGYSDVFKDSKYDPKLTTSQDYDLWMRIATKFRVANLDEFLLFYRVHDSNASRKRIQLSEILGIAKTRLTLTKANSVSPICWLFATIIWSAKNLAFSPLAFMNIGIKFRKLMRTKVNRAGFVGD
jgi:glycosyltransferase involved in cell wall biosynthesis